MPWGLARGAVPTITVPTSATRYVLICASGAIALTDSQFPERFRSRVEKIVRSFERAERNGRPTSTRMDGWRKSAAADLRQWRRSHGYTQATAGRAQPADGRAQVMADQLGERLAEADARVSELEDELEDERAERLTLAGAYEDLQVENEELMALLVERSAQLAVSKRNILSFFLTNSMQGPHPGDDGLRGRQSCFGGFGQ